MKSKDHIGAVCGFIILVCILITAMLFNALLDGVLISAVLVVLVIFLRPQRFYTLFRCIAPLAIGCLFVALYLRSNVVNDFFLYTS